MISEAINYKEAKSSNFYYHQTNLVHTVPSLTDVLKLRLYIPYNTKKQKTKKKMNIFCTCFLVFTINNYIYIHTYIYTIKDVKLTSI